MKIKGVFLLIMVALSPFPTYAGGESGGGGDPLESRVDEIRADILRWVIGGAPANLSLPNDISHAAYSQKMAYYLSPGTVVVSFVTTSQEGLTGDEELRVYVDGVPKVCRGFISTKDSRPHILCNVERYSALSATEEYRLIHHEYAGLAGVERNIGAVSDYSISNQLTDFLVEVRVLRLAIKKRPQHKKPEGYHPMDPGADRLQVRGGAIASSGQSRPGGLVALSWIRDWKKFSKELESRPDLLNDPAYVKRHFLKLDFELGRLNGETLGKAEAINSDEFKRNWALQEKLLVVKVTPLTNTVLSFLAGVSLTSDGISGGSRTDNESESHLSVMIGGTAAVFDRVNLSEARRGEARISGKWHPRRTVSLDGEVTGGLTFPRDTSVKGATERQKGVGRYLLVESGLNLKLSERMHLRAEADYERLDYRTVPLDRDSADPHSVRRRIFTGKLLIGGTWGGR